MIGDPLRVIAGRHGDDTPARLIRRQALQLVIGAAILEGTGELLVLELEKELCHAGLPGHPGRFHARRQDNVAANDLGRVPDIVETGELEGGGSGRRSGHEGTLVVG